MSSINPIASGAIPQSQNTQVDVGAEFNTFIKLLTAQVRNQDPLSPLDSTQFVEQLATFSALEQQVSANQNLEYIAIAMDNLYALIGSEWIGQVVSIQSSYVPYTSDPITFTADLPDEINKAILTIQNSDGEIIWSEELDTTATDYTWDGSTISGVSVPDGTLLQMKIDVFEDNQFAGSIAPKIITKVTSISNEGGELRFNTSSLLSGNIDQFNKITD